MALKAEEVYAILKKQIQSGGGTPGPAGVGIQKIEKTGTEGLVDTYTITYTNGQTTTYTVTNGADGESGIAPRQQMQDTDVNVTLQPNILYVFPEMASLTVTLAEPSNTDIVNEWHWFFDSGETACVFTLQNQDGSQVYTDAYSIDANMRYEVSVLNNVAYIKGVAITANGE